MVVVKSSVNVWEEAKTTMGDNRMNKQKYVILLNVEFKTMIYGSFFFLGSNRTMSWDHDGGHRAKTLSQSAYSIISQTNSIFNKIAVIWLTPRI